MKFHDIELQGQRFSLPSVTSIIGLARDRRMLIGDEWLTWSDDAVSIGTQAHKHIASILSGNVIPHHQWKSLEESLRNTLRAFIRWWEFTRFKPRLAELVVCSIEYGVAGTIDATGLIKRYANLVDWKTGVLNTGGRIQLGGYYLCYLETYPKRRIHEGRLVHLDKQTANFEQEIISEQELLGYAQDFIKIRTAIGAI